MRKKEPALNMDMLDNKEPWEDLFRESEASRRLTEQLDREAERTASMVGLALIAIGLFIFGCLVAYVISGLVQWIGGL